MPDPQHSGAIFLLAFEQAGDESEAFIRRFTLVPWHLGGLSQNAEMCKPCARNIP
jgi:hypothetical protein